MVRSRIVLTFPLLNNLKTVCFHRAFDMTPNHVEGSLVPDVALELGSKSNLQHSNPLRQSVVSLVF